MTNAIGIAIGKYRRERGLAQKELAKLIGITPTYMSQIEKGKKMPSYPLLGKICTALNIQETNLYKDLFLDSLLNESLTVDQKEIAVLLRQLFEKISDITPLKKQKRQSAIY